MGKAMMEYILGPMPAQAFLNEFFPLNGLSDLKGATHKQNCYIGVVRVKKEKGAYDPFLSSLRILILLYSLYHVDQGNCGVYHWPVASQLFKSHRQ